jgi:hypothetical protein
MSEIISIIVKGGLVMIPLVLCSVVSLAVTIERLLYWHRISPKQPVEQMLASVEQGKLKEALSDGQESPLPAARVLAAGLAHRNPSYSKAMEVAAQGEMPILKRRLVILDTIITLAPLLGLLGTITGHDQLLRDHVRRRTGPAPRCNRRRRRGPYRDGNGPAHRDSHSHSLQLFYLPRGKRNGGYRIFRLASGARPARATGGPLMRLQRKGNLKKARIEIIPMIDTIFFLLVFFMISTLSMARFTGVQVNLPKAASGSQPRLKPSLFLSPRTTNCFLIKRN